MTKPTLKVDWATHEASLYACKTWHYSKSIPAGKLVKVGVWEDSIFQGVVLFSRGANNNLLKLFGLEQTQGCELTRIALKSSHQTPVSRVLRLAILFLRRFCPYLRLIVSFADASQGHHGGVYQANGWIYTGGANTHAYRIKGVQYHPKTLHSRYGKDGQSVEWLRKNIDKTAERINAGFKHRYIMPLDPAMRAAVVHLAKPYPRREKQAMTPAQGEQRQCGADPHAPNNSISDDIHN